MRKDYRQNKMGGGMMRSTYSAGTVKPKNKKLAAMYGDKNKITRGDIITAAKKNTVSFTEKPVEMTPCNSSQTVEVKGTRRMLASKSKTATWY